MSAGRVHVKGSLILASGFLVGALIFQDPRLFECAAGALTGILVGCDLDVDSGNISNAIVKKRVGWFSERLWRWFWRGYSSSFKHGQFASHFPIFSTFVRLAYIFFLTILPFYAVYFIILHSPNYYSWLMNELAFWVTMFLRPMFFCGLAGSDFIHFALDVSTTAHTLKKA